MADIGITKFRVQIPRDGATPSTPGFAQSEGQDPVNPPGSPTGIYVPYLGATGGVNLGEFGLTTGYVTFDTTPTNIPTTQGTMYWDDARQTVALIMNGTTQHIGQFLSTYVKNSSGASIPKGRNVRNSGTDGGSGHVLIEPFLADGTHPSETYLGVTAEEIPNGGFGQVIDYGKLPGINTSTYTAGAFLYVSTSVAGQFQTTAPVAPNNIILVGRAVNSKNNGDIFIRPHIGSNIRNDEGVRIVSPTNGQALLYNSTSQLWENGAVTASETIQTVSTSGTINDLSTTATTIVFTGATVTLTGIVALSNGAERTIINRTGSNMLISYLSASSSANNRMFFTKTIPNGGVIGIKYSTDSGNVWLLKSGVFDGTIDSLGQFTLQDIGVKRSNLANISLAISSGANADSRYALSCERLDGTRTFEVRSVSAFCYTPMGIGLTPSIGSGRTLVLRSLSGTGWPFEIFDNAGTSRILVFNNGDIGSTSGLILGASSSFTSPVGRLDVRGKGTGTGITLLLEDSGGNNTFEFLDNGNLSIPSTNGAKIGTATSQKIGFWNATPIVQPTTGVAESAFVENAGGTAVNDDSTFDGYTLRQVVKALRDAGLLA